MHTPQTAETDAWVQTAQAVLVAAVLVAAVSLAFACPAHAQDVLGVSTLRERVILVFKGIAVIALGFGFLKLMGARQEMAALVVLAVGGLGIAKLEAIAGALGL